MNLKLSEAIRLGALNGPQLFGVLFDRTGASCALGSALLAVAPREGWGWDCRSKWDKVYRIFPILTTIVPRCPNVYCDRFWCPSTVHEMIVHLNNEHRLSRNVIAYWVESIERESPVEPTGEVALARTSLRSEECGSQPQGSASMSEGPKHNHADLTEKVMV